MLNDLLATIGFKQKWHISWIAKIPGRDISFGDGSYTVKGVLTASRINELREVIAKETGNAAGCEVTVKQINIVGMAKIGG